MKKLILVIAGFLILASCGKKEEELVEEKPSSTETPKTDSVKNETDAKREAKDTSKIDRKSYELARELEAEETISPLEANDYIGRIVAVKGFVAEVNKREKVAYLNFIEKFPETPFTAVIFSSKFDEFGSLEIYKNKHVEVTGRVTTYKGRPQIILESKSQIRILE